jgi:putative intracellular protease/amidase
MTRILIIFTSADKALDGNQTGYYLPEAAHPYYTFKDAGFDIEFASPKGPNPPVDKYSVEAYSDQQGTQFLSDPEVKAKFAATKKLSDVKVESYDAIFYVGGHGPVIDLPSDENNVRFASKFYQTGKLVAAVCHGPAALVNVTDASGKSIFAGGKKFTGFSNNEENAVHKVQAIPFLLEDKIGSLGGAYESGEAWAPYITVDGNLYTGQNPASAKPLADAVVKALNA